MRNIQEVVQMNKNRRSGLNITVRLLALVKPLAKIMVLAIIMGT